VPSLRDLTAQRQVIVDQAVALDERMGANPSLERRHQMRGLQGELKTLDSRIEEATVDTPVRTAIYDTGGEHRAFERFRTPAGGDALAEVIENSTALADWRRDYPNGPSTRSEFELAPIEAPGLLKNLIRARTLITGGDASAGDLVSR
jgi:hypothetical protein